MVFPAVAIDGEMNLHESFQLTEGNGWRLVVIVGVLPWALTSAINSIWYTDMPMPVFRNAQWWSSLENLSKDSKFQIRSQGVCPSAESRNAL